MKYVLRNSFPLFWQPPTSVLVCGYQKSMIWTAILQISICIHWHTCRTTSARFGPAIRFSTEAFEAYNAIFRACSVRSNRQAPSRDIARKLASVERVKHIFTGGFWYDEKHGKWLQASPLVLQIVVDGSRHLGWVSQKLVECGTVRMLSEKQQPLITWATSGCGPYWSDHLGLQPALKSTWRQALTVTIKNGDAVWHTSWVYALDSTRSYFLGRVSKILAGKQVFILLERFVCTETVHPDFKWPVIRRPSGAEIVGGMTSYTIVKPDDVQFAALLSMTAVADYDKRFVLNLAGFHNFMELRRILPDDFTRLKPLHNDRKTFHNDKARQAQELRLSNREKAAAKRKAKTAEKRRLAADAAVDAAVAETQFASAAQKPGGRAKLAEKKRQAVLAAAEAATAEMEEIVEDSEQTMDLLGSDLEEADSDESHYHSDEEMNDEYHLPGKRKVTLGNTGRITRARARTNANK
ncbi:hypothetical protein MIND_01427200 [Mycena indigotica]|uniref:Uncharacterized protein n=1 Tax=Mycena indigotica TaxID=2126181 RepID=A0A8H6RX92_9AGAR|nr:uncharacterized protein MIND_01427200 [Mycena indigotica]KAF7288606.1 hypothetical protein MIND_01427200 [Mycena indigotica]